MKWRKNGRGIFVVVKAAKRAWRASSNIWSDVPFNGPFDAEKVINASEMATQTACCYTLLSRAISITHHVLIPKAPQPRVPEVAGERWPVPRLKQQTKYFNVLLISGV